MHPSTGQPATTTLKPTDSPTVTYASSHKNNPPPKSTVTKLHYNCSSTSSQRKISTSKPEKVVHSGPIATANPRHMPATTEGKDAFYPLFSVLSKCCNTLQFLFVLCSTSTMSDCAMAHKHCTQFHALCIPLLYNALLGRFPSPALYNTLQWQFPGSTKICQDLWCHSSVHVLLTVLEAGCGESRNC
jgi:Gpi18-like mannosyltransferase